MRIISLGWGVQSFTLAAMAALGDIEPVDAAVHADTTHERSQTYAFAKRWTPWLEQRGVRVVTVVSDDVSIIINRPGGKILIPAYTNTPSRRGGQLRRQCTDNWKIKPIRRWLQANRDGQNVEQLLGISLDEFQRMRDSDVGYITNKYPLVDQRMSRDDCERWLLERGLEIPVKSSCVFCPYHNRVAWEEMYRKAGDDWIKAVDVDETIRKMRPPYDLFLHSSRRPLASLDLRTPQERGQLELWANWDKECSGICGV